MGLVCVVLGLAGRKPNDLTVLLGGAPSRCCSSCRWSSRSSRRSSGNSPTGNLVEFWVYLISALVIPPLAIFWALVERTRWSNVVLGVAAFAIAVML